jgi:hypothetical protein
LGPKPRRAPALRTIRRPGPAALTPAVTSQAPQLRNHPPTILVLRMHSQ